MPIPGPAWHDFGWVIGSTCCRHKAAVVYPDTLSVGTRVGALSDDRLLMEYQAVSRNSGQGGCGGRSVLVAYDFDAGRVILSAMASATRSFVWRAGSCPGCRGAPRASSGLSTRRPAALSVQGFESAGFEAVLLHIAFFGQDTSRRNSGIREHQDASGPPAKAQIRRVPAWPRPSLPCFSWPFWPYWSSFPGAAPPPPR